MGERHAQRIFRSAGFGPTKRARFSIVLLKDEEGGMEVVWFAGALDAMEKNLGCICVRWSSSDEVDNRSCDKELKHRVVMVGE